MNVITTTLPGVLIIEPLVFQDPRGFFKETFNLKHYSRHGIPGNGLSFVQDNHSRSKQGVLRGLHFQIRHPQGKLASVGKGKVFDVAVDICPSSPTFRKWVGVELSDENHRQIYIPPGYAHGFCVLSESVDFQYKCTEYYYPDDEGGVLWNDPVLNIDWPIKYPLISGKDSSLPKLMELSPDDIPSLHI